MSERFARSCAGKKRYNSARRATEAAKAAQIIYAQEMNAYLCCFCGRFHIGSTHPWEGRIARLEGHNEDIPDSQSAHQAAPR